MTWFKNVTFLIVFYATSLTLSDVLTNIRGFSIINLVHAEF